MKNKTLQRLFCLVFALALLCGAGVLRAFATAPQEVLDGILARKLSVSGKASTQEWLDTSLCETAGTGAEWYVLSLYQSGESYSFAAYEAALRSYLSEHSSSGASSREKYALALLCAGADETDDFVAETLTESIGGEGIMSEVFGLHLLNNGLQSPSFSAEQLVEMLLARRNADGGWSLFGSASDVDVTAMTLQALAPHCGGNGAVDTAAKQALAFLSERQNEDGSYNGFGVCNAESSAQVLTALTCLRIDPLTDPRFQKNGNTVLDALLRFRLETGGFSHTLRGAENENATSQAFYALVSLSRFREGKGSLYVLDTKASLPPQSAETPSEASGASTPAPGYKLSVCIGIAVLGASACLIMYGKKKRRFKDFLLPLLLSALFIGATLLTDIRSPEAYYAPVADTGKEPIGQVTLSIRCDTLLSENDARVPEDGAILSATPFSFSENDTAYDILVRAAREQHLQLDAKGAAGMRYISGIAYLYEFEFGPLSGWIYRVNGLSPAVGCGEYRLSDGDNIEFLYTRALGEDLGGGVA